jgi:hypothetical protein
MVERASLRRRALAITTSALAALGASGTVAARASVPSGPLVPMAKPAIMISSPAPGRSYQRRSRAIARYRCAEHGAGVAIVSCKGTVAPGRALDTAHNGLHSFTVIAIDAAGRKLAETVRYRVWSYANPLAEISGLEPSRIDMGVDYVGAGPILAIGRAKVLQATDRTTGPESCWGKTCSPAPGDWIVYRLLDGPFAHKFVYVVENITILVKPGQLVRAGQQIAILHEGSPNLELGWAAGRPTGAWTLAAWRGPQCACADPGGWSSIEGRNFNTLLTWLGAPSGSLTTVPSGQRMPRGWPTLPAHDTAR